MTKIIKGIKAHLVSNLDIGTAIPGTIYIHNQSFRRLSCSGVTCRICPFINREYSTCNVTVHGKVDIPKVKHLLGISHLLKSRKSDDNT